MVQLANRLFGITVEAADGEATVWHPDVRFFAVKQDGEPKAFFYMDPYSRPSEKQGGAWFCEVVGQSRLFAGPGKFSNESVRLPVAHVICNQTPPVGSNPSLMTFRYSPSPPLPYATLRYPTLLYLPHSILPYPNRPCSALPYPARPRPTLDHVLQAAVSLYGPLQANLPYLALPYIASYPSGFLGFLGIWVVSMLPVVLGMRPAIRVHEQCMSSAQGR